MLSSQRLNFSPIVMNDSKAEKILSAVVVVVSWIMGLVVGMRGSLGFFSKIFIVAVSEALVISIYISLITVMTSLWGKRK